MKKNSFSNKEQWKYTNPKEFILSSKRYSPPKKSLNIKCNDNEIIIHNGCIYLVGNKLKKRGLSIHDKLNKNDLKIKIPKKLIINKPIKIKHIIDSSNNKLFLHYNILIEVGDNSKLSIINEELFDTNNCIAIKCEILLKENAHLNLYNYSEKPKTKQLLDFVANLSKNSKLNIDCIDISGKLIKNNYFINLNKIGSECYFNSLNLTNNKDHIDNFIEIYHNNSNTISNLTHKSAANGKSTSILFAKAIIQKNSSNTEAYQKNDNLMLSEKSTIYSNPQLEIYNDNVQCSHSSTTGQIDDDAIFYMKTRGLNEKESKKLLLNGFFNDSLQKIKLLYPENYFTKKINSYLKDVN